MRSEEQERLHSAIMNLPCNASEKSAGELRVAYKMGHRDARHAAAELALASLSTPPDIPKGAVGVMEEDAFEQLCREHDIYGTAAARQCEVFWKAGARFAAPVSPEPADSNPRCPHGVTLRIRCESCEAASQPAEAVSDEQIFATIKGMDRLPHGIGSRRSDAVAFARAILALAATPVAAQPAVEPIFYNSENRTLMNREAAAVEPAIPGNTYESITAALDLPELSGDCTQRINQLIAKRAAAVEPAKVDVSNEFVRWASYWFGSDCDEQWIAQAIANMPATTEPVAPAKAPEGWKLVPIKPTREMMAAAVQRICYGPEGGFTRISGPQSAWAAMLDAAPAVAEPVEGAEPAVKVCEEVRDRLWSDDSKHQQSAGADACMVALRRYYASLAPASAQAGAVPEVDEFDREAVMVQLSASPSAVAAFKRILKSLAAPKAGSGESK